MTRKLERELKREFPFTEIELTGGGHYRLRLPNGQIVIVASTPGHRSFMRNVRRDVRRQMRSAPFCDAATFPTNEPEHSR